jgi:hypothetical protein
MYELPGIGIALLLIIGDEVLSVPEWRVELAAGDND